MGIQGLLPLLKEISTPIHIKEWEGKTLAVDAYVWLHRGAYGCAEELALGKPTLKYIKYAMHRVRMLKHFGVTPYIVFDGGLLPSKEKTEVDREQRRADAMAKANAFLSEGKRSQARDCFVKAVDVTPAMAYQLIKALKREGIEYVVAPYEADAQLAYLEHHGHVDGIITEDSDLLVFGCKAVLFKLDSEGNCVQVKRSDFGLCREYNFTGWTDQQFRQMAILSGCDYVDSIAGLGLKTAYKMMRKYKSAEKVIQVVRLEGQLQVPVNYPADFKRAELTFCHQLVFDPIQRVLVHREPLPTQSNLDDMPFVGASLDSDFARGVASGQIDPITKKPMVDIFPEAHLDNSDLFHQSRLFNDTNNPTSTTKTTTSSASFYKLKTSLATLKKTSTPVAQGASSLLGYFEKKSVLLPRLNSCRSPTKGLDRPTPLKRRKLEDEKENMSPPKRRSKFFGGPKPHIAPAPGFISDISRESSKKIVQPPRGPLVLAAQEAEEGSQEDENDSGFGSSPEKEVLSPDDCLILSDEDVDVMVERKLPESSPRIELEEEMDEQTSSRQIDSDRLALVANELTKSLGREMSVEDSASLFAVSSPINSPHQTTFMKQDQNEETITKERRSSFPTKDWDLVKSEVDTLDFGVVSSPLASIVFAIETSMKGEEGEEEEGAVSSPIASPLKQSFKLELALQVSTTPQKPTENQEEMKNSHELPLCSDPIEPCPNPHSSPEDVQFSTPLAKTKPVFTSKNSSKRKPAGRNGIAEEDDEGMAPALASVAASWKAKFMHPACPSSTPRMGQFREPSKENAVATTNCKESSPARTPTARSHVVQGLSAQTFIDKGSTTPKSITHKRKPLSNLNTNVNPTNVVSARASSPDTILSSSPKAVEITNKRLLAFKFLGSPATAV